MKDNVQNESADETPIVLYTTPDGVVCVNALVKDQTLWMTQMFDVVVQNVTYHLKNVFETGELVESATCKEILQV